MRSTSCKEIAGEIFAQCLAGQPPKALPLGLLEAPCTQALFGTIVEGLADRFDPALCDTYARLFAGALGAVGLTWDATGWDAVSLVARYERIRRPRPISGKPQRIFVLSRVTLGADVAVTSVLLAAAKRHFPRAKIVFCGPAKNYELFAADPRIHHAPLEYRRGSLAERLEAGRELRALVEASPRSIVIDPDSRLTQLGMLPVCPEESYYFFESRAHGGTTDRPLPELAAEWAHEIIGRTAKPFVALGRRMRKPVGISVSLGVGDNPAKRLPEPFEVELLKMLGETGMPLFIDTGAGGEERERVLRAIAAAGVTAATWDGSFAGFARIIAASRLYVGYDSAGQHVAAACGVPLISIFAGFPCDRMFARWRPQGAAAHVIRVDEPQVEATLARVKEALDGTAVGAE